MQRQGGKKEIRVWCLFRGHYIANIVEIRLSNEKRAPGCLVYIGDEQLPSYIGIVINHDKDPY